ncbi:hypothetical protein NF212_09315 [Parasalinivibrio latis]|uniref:hypothetical protein n=1 Tax=Parasalinivibrio latis TaxID=2952610 RepID=UPI0030E2C158
MKHLLKVIIPVAALSWSTAGVTEELSAETWVEIEIAVRSLTVEGMENRHAFLQQGASLESQYDSDSDIQSRIGDIYRNNGTTAVDHINFGRHNHADITTWLDGQPGYQDQLDSIDSAFASAQARIAALEAD